MEKRSIVLRMDTYKRLKVLGKKGDTFNDIVKMLLGEYENNTS